VDGDGDLDGVETTSTSITTTISTATATSEAATDHPTCRLAAEEILLGGIIRNIAEALRTETVPPQTGSAG
jgi:hypothetical protein